MLCRRLCCLGILLAATGVAAGQEQDFSKVEIRTKAWSERYSPPKAFVDTDAFTDTLYNSLRAHVARDGNRPR